jgi:hypothetical protein
MPIVLVIVTQLSAGTGVGPGAGAAPPSTAGAGLPVPLDPVEAEPVPVMPGVAVPPETVPEPALPLPEQPVYVGKSHEKPAPQSESTLQASSHLYRQVETLVVVQTGGMSGAKHLAFGGQVDPPAHDWIMSV